MLTLRTLRDVKISEVLGSPGLRNPPHPTKTSLASLQKLKDKDLPKRG